MLSISQLVKWSNMCIRVLFENTFVYLEIWTAFSIQDLASMILCDSCYYWLVSFCTLIHLDVNALSDMNVSKWNCGQDLDLFMCFSLTGFVPWTSRYIFTIQLYIFILVIYCIGILFGPKFTDLSHSTVFLKRKMDRIRTYVSNQFHPEALVYLVNLTDLFITACPT